MRIILYALHMGVVTIFQQCNQLIIDFGAISMKSEKEVVEPPTAKRKVTMEDFTIKHRLGKGAYGDVFLVLKNSDHRPYALKQIQKRKLEREQKEYQAMVERELLANLKHPGIIKLLYSFQDKSSLNFVTEYCMGGDFINFTKANIEKLSERTKVFYIGEIVNLLEYLHGVGVTHRDLKPQNLMLDRRGHLKLIDFGTAQITQCTILKPQFKEHITKLKKEQKQVESTQPTEEYMADMGEMDSPLKKRRSTFVGTCYYISPELLEQNYCPAPADLWALGCIIYQLYYLDTPFKDSYEFAVFEKIKRAEYSFPKNQSITEEAIDLIKRLLVRKPEERLGSGVTQELSFQKLKSHPYFKGLDIDNVFNMPVPYIEDLQTIDRTQAEKKEYQESYETFKGSVEEILKTISEEGKEIVKHEILEEKTFIIFGYSLLIFCKGGELMLVRSDEIEKRRQIVLKKTEEGPCKVKGDTLLIYEQDWVFQLKTAQAQQWSVAIKTSSDP